MINTTQISCIRKNNGIEPHERIQGVGGVSPDGFKRLSGNTHPAAGNPPG
jgi:hypothetical protein